MVNTIYLSPIAIKSSDLFHTVHLVSIERLGFAFFFRPKRHPKSLAQNTAPNRRPPPSLPSHRHPYALHSAPASMLSTPLLIAVPHPTLEPMLPPPTAWNRTPERTHEAPPSGHHRPATGADATQPGRKGSNQPKLWVLVCFYHTRLRS
jgi:hypothetical protein